MIKIFPSTNPSPEDKLLNYVTALQKIGVEFMHLDVMDGIFVPNRCLDLSIIEEIATKTTVGLDVHLMLVEPVSNIQKYMHLPATYITTHYEAYNNVQSIIKVSKYVRKSGKLMGISLKPNTPVSKIKDILPLFDLVLIMSVEPGSSGQAFIESTYDKIRELRQMIDSRKLNIKIEIDGGVNESNMQQVVDAGADILVMGNAIYTSTNREVIMRKAISMYRKAISQ